jgi:hypothetical protein
MAAHRKSGQRRDDLCEAGLRKRALRRRSEILAVHSDSIFCIVFRASHVEAKLAQSLDQSVRIILGREIYSPVNRYFLRGRKTRGFFAVFLQHLGEAIHSSFTGLSYAAQPNIC